MTAITGVPAQQTGAAAPRAAKNGADAARDASHAGKAEGFGSVFSRVGAERSAPSKAPQPEPGNDGNEGAFQPRRPRDAQAKPLQAEDVLPAELLLTLAPQQPSAPIPVPQAAPLDFAALTVLPGLAPNEASTEPLSALPGSMGNAAPGRATVPMAGQAAPPAADPLAAFSSALSPAATVLSPSLAAAPPSAPPPQAGLLAAAAPQGPQLLAPIQPKAPPSMPRQRDPRAEADLPSLAPQPMGGGQEDLESLIKNPVKPPERTGDFAITVTRQETILPPPGQMPAIQQTADRIIGELATMAEDLAPTEAASTRRDSEPAITRVLHLQLDPPDLGVLTVKLALRDNTLSIRVEAAEPGTARLLDQDRERLSEMLRSAGYGMEGVTVQISAPERSQPQTAFNAMMGAGGDNPAQSGSGAQSQPGGAQADAQRGHQSRRGNGELPGSAPDRNAGENGPRPGSADGDLYL
jgi:chemotaxis protein MotD